MPERTRPPRASDTAGAATDSGARVLKPRKAVMAEAQFAISFDESFVTA
jgi:hypothetical protein